MTKHVGLFLHNRHIAHTQSFLRDFSRAGGLVWQYFKSLFIRRRLPSFLAHGSVSSQDIVAALMHEISNPLGTLVNVAYALSENDNPGIDRKALARTLQTEAMRVQHLTETFSLICRDQNNKQAGFDLSETVADLLLLAPLEPELKQHRKIISDIPEGHLPVKGNPEQIRQVFWNLLLNASRHGEGPIYLQIQLLPKHVHVSLRNRCRTQPTCAREARGMGLGLSVSSYILSRHRSALCIEKRGDTFESSFMLHRAHLVTTALSKKQPCVF